MSPDQVDSLGDRQHKIEIEIKIERAFAQIHYTGRFSYIFSKLA